MDWHFWIPLGVTIAIGIVNAYQTDLTRRQLKLQTDAMNRSSKKSKVNIFIPWKYRYGPTVAMVLLAAVSWIPYFMGAAGPIPSGQPFMTLFGQSEPFELSNPLLRVETDGTFLSSYQKDYRLAAVAFRYYGNGDIKDASNLQKSGLYDIENGKITIFIHLDEQFMRTMQHGEIRTNYFLLLVPNKVQPSQFSTLRQAESLGAKILQGGAGPP